MIVDFSESKKIKKVHICFPGEHIDYCGYAVHPMAIEQVRKIILEHYTVAVCYLVD